MAYLETSSKATSREKKLLNQYHSSVNYNPAFLISSLYTMLFIAIQAKHGPCSLHSSAVQTVLSCSCYLSGAQGCEYKKCILWLSWNVCEVRKNTDWSSWMRDSDTNCCQCWIRWLCTPIFHGNNIPITPYEEENEHTQTCLVYASGNSLSFSNHYKETDLAAEITFRACYYNSKASFVSITYLNTIWNPWLILIKQGLVTV